MHVQSCCLGYKTYCFFDVLIAVALALLKLHILFIKTVAYLTIIPRTCVGYEMIDSQRNGYDIIIISYPTCVNGIIVLLKTIKDYC